MKKILIIVFLLFITSCSNKNDYIDTIIIENDNFLVNINYPVTGTELDINIKNDIKNIYNNYQYINGELNIDYLYYKIDSLISVSLFIYVNGENVKKNYVKTYFYNNKISNIKNLIDINKLNKILINKIKNTNLNIEISDNYEFSFDNTNLYIYFNYDNNYETTNIPLSDLNIFFEKEKKVINEIILPDNNINYNDKVIALTFDDGPSKYTDKLIEYLYQNDCKATFFILGNKVKNYQDILNKSISYGNEIGNHSYNHKWLIKLKKDEIIDQINKTQNLIYEYTGYIPTLLRPTYGSINSTLSNSTNLNIVLWNVDTLDWKYKSIDKIVAKATKNLKSGNIILMHDIYKRTYDAVKKIVPLLKENGYNCVTISELNKINNLKKLYE